MRCILLVLLLAMPLAQTSMGQTEESYRALRSKIEQIMYGKDGKTRLQKVPTFRAIESTLRSNKVKYSE